MKLSRSLALNLSKYIVRPVKKVENYDVVKSTELKIDETIAVFFRRYLNFTGLKSIMMPTSFGQMHYYDSNPTSNLKPLILVHGLGCTAQNMWLLGKMFANKRRIIMPDLFHMGGFSIPQNSIMNVQDHTQSLLEFIKQITPHSVDLCGSSMGGWFSLLIAAKEKLLVRNLILITPSGPSLKLPELKETILNLTWREFKYMYPGILKAFPYTGVPIFSAAARRGSYRNLKRKQVADLLRVIKPEDFLESLLTEIKSSVLLLWGSEDKFLSSKIPELMMKSIKNIHGKWIGNCAHAPHLETPAVCYNEINQFLNLTKIKDNDFSKFILKFSKMHKVSPIEKGFHNDY